MEVGVFVVAPPPKTKAPGAPLPSPVIISKLEGNGSRVTFEFCPRACETPNIAVFKMVGEKMCVFWKLSVFRTRRSLLRKLGSSAGLLRNPCDSVRFNEKESVVDAL